MYRATCTTDSRKSSEASRRLPCSTHDVNTLRHTGKQEVVVCQSPIPLACTEKLVLLVFKDRVRQTDRQTDRTKKHRRAVSHERDKSNKPFGAKFHRLTKTPRRVKMPNANATIGPPFPKKKHLVNHTVQVLRQDPGERGGPYHSRQVLRISAAIFAHPFPIFYFHASLDLPDRV